MVHLVVAIPSSVLSVEHGLLLKTIRIHQILRFASIYGVSQLTVYRDPFTKPSDHYIYTNLFKKISDYFLTPPYLRRRIIRPDEDLKFVGAMPPLRLNVYDVSRKGRVGEKRVAALVDGTRGLVDVGLNSLFRVVNVSDCIVVKGRLTYVELLDLDLNKARCVENGTYLGPSIEFTNSLNEALNRYFNDGFFILATSRWGEEPSLSELIKIKGIEKLLIAFGSPNYGLHEIAEKEGFELKTRVNVVWKTILNQRVKTVRTEEALISTLALINFFIEKKNG